MGNAHSSAAPRGQNRLTKPRTNISKNPTSTQLSVTTAFGKTISNPLPSTSTIFQISPNELSLNRQFYDGERGVYNGYQEQSQASDYHYSFTRDSMNGNLEQIPEPADFDPNPHNATLYGSRTSTMASLQWGKRSSSTVATTSRLSLAMSMRYHDVDDVAGQPDNPEGNASADEEVIINRVLSPNYEQESRDGLRPLPSRASSAAIRRRSLAITPGIATRNPIPSVRQALSIRKEKVRLSVPEVPSWMRERASPSPPVCLSTLAPPSFSSNTPSSRAGTPADLDYTHLGGLKLGSLVVTNGHASPDPTSTAGKCDYFDSAERSTDLVDGRKGSLPVSKSQNLLHRKTWSAGMLGSSLDGQDQIDFPRLYDESTPVTKNDQHQIISGLDDVKGSIGTLQGQSSCPPVMGSPDMLVSPRTVVGSDRQEDLLAIRNAGPHYGERPANEDDIDISEEEAKSFRNEALRILENSILAPEQQQSSGHCSSRPSTNGQSFEKPAGPIQTKSDSGYCSEYSVGAFSRNSSAKSHESLNTEEGVRLLTVGQSTDRPGNVDLPTDLAAEGAKQQTTPTDVTARRKSSGFLRLRTKSSRETSSSIQNSLIQRADDTRTERELKATRSTDPVLGPRKLQKKNPALHQSFIIVSNTGRSPLSSSNSSVDNLQRLPQREVGKSHQNLLSETGKTRNEMKGSSKRERSMLKPLFLRSTSTPNISNDGPNHFSTSIPEPVANASFSERMERKKNLDQRGKPMQQQNKRGDADPAFSHIKAVSTNTDNLPRKVTNYASSLRSVESEKIPSRSNSAAGLKPILKSDHGALLPRPDGPSRSLSVRSISVNDAEKLTLGETRDHRFALDVPPVPSIPMLSHRKSSSRGLNGSIEGLSTAKAAQSVTPTVVSQNRRQAGVKGLTVKRSREELVRFITQAAKKPPSPSKRRFYKEVRDHQAESRRSLGDVSAVGQQSARSRRSFGSLSDKWPGRSNHSDLSISLRA